MIMTRQEEIRLAGQRICWPSESTIAFKKGAEWADEHPKEGLVDLSQVWHEPKEEPKIGECILGEYQGGIYQTYLCGYVDCEWSSYAKVFSLIRWAYVNDLLPKGGKL